jgi:phosphatidylinositol 3-kinase
LLSGGKSFQSPIVRSYAVDVLRNASDQELQVLLLQLVQALRYEPMMTAAPISSQRSDEDLGTISPNTIYTSENDNNSNSNTEEISQEGVKIEGFEDLEKLNSTTVPSLSSLSPLGRFLISRACTSTVRKSFPFPSLPCHAMLMTPILWSVANYFYWFLKVEIEDSNMGEMFQNVFRVFMHELKSSNEAGRLMEKKLTALNKYIDTISR